MPDRKTFPAKISHGDHGSIFEPVGDGLVSRLVQEFDGTVVDEYPTDNPGTERLAQYVSEGLVRTVNHVAQRAIAALNTEERLLDD